jgi:hypothetical protein
MPLEDMNAVVSGTKVQAIGLVDPASTDSTVAADAASVSRLGSES